MQTAIIFDSEFLCLKDSQRRFWCGPDDPDPVIAQIGAAKLGLDLDYPILETFSALIQPIDRHGERYRLDPFFTQLTGITEEAIADRGMSLERALQDLNRFSGGARFWSWGKDELNMVAISCFVAGVPFAIPAHRFDNAAELLLAAGMPVEDLVKTPSNKLAAYYGVEHPPLRAHDAEDDALSVAYTLRHLLRAGALRPETFDRPS